MKRVFALTLILAGFWMINSGYFKPLLLSLGVASVILTIAITHRMTKRDGEIFSLIMPSLRLPGYLLWMLGQIFMSNIDVMKKIWLGPSSISPAVIKTKASQKSEIGRVLYANSITMTPGTVTLSIHGDVLEVHALTSESAAQLQTGEMDRRAAALEAA